MNEFIPKDTLDLLSYRSTLGQSLKQVSLSGTLIETILDDIAKYRTSYIDTLVQENLIGSRFKSEDYYFNLWSHQYVYKYKSPEIGRMLYREYDAGTIRTEQEFQKRLLELEVKRNG